MLPDSIYQEITRLLDGPTADRSTALARLCADHPEHAAAIQEWVQGVLSTPSPAPGEPTVVASASRAIPPSLTPTPVSPTRWQDQPWLQHLPCHAGLPVVDQFVLFRFVGRGGFGAVYRARHRRLGTDSAIKILHDAERDPKARHRFEREARLGATLSSPFLVKVTDLGTCHGVDYLVMEWVDGENLASRVRRLGPRPLPEVVALLHGVAQALAVAHQHGVVHRDVKPANILLRRDGQVKLADLGLAHRDADPHLSSSRASVGTPAYMAPEQRYALAEAGPRADVFAVGATACFLLGGEPLRAQADARQALPAAVARAAPEFAAWVERCLARDAEDRFADGGELLAALAAAVPLAKAQPLTAEVLLLDPDEATDAPDESVLAAIEDELRARATAAVLAVSQRQSPTPLPDLRPRAVRWWWLAGVVPALGVAWWLFGRGAEEPTEREVGARPAVVEPPKEHRTETAAGAEVGAPGAAAAKSPPSGSHVAPPEQSKSAPTQPPPNNEPRPVPPRIAEIRIAGLPVPATESPCVLAAVPFGETGTVPIQVVTTAGVPEVKPEVRSATLRPVVNQDGGEWRIHITVESGTHSLTIAVGDDERVLQLSVPSIPPAVPGLELARGDDRSGVHYRLALGELQHLRFLSFSDDLLVGVTEISERQFRAFVASDYEPELRGDTEFTAWLTKHRFDLATRRERWLKVLDSASDLPVCNVHPSEAQAMGRWAGRRLGGGFSVSLPTSAQWREIANRNADRPADAFDVPAWDPKDANLLPAVQNEPQEGSDGRTPRPVAQRESLWSRRQGRLFHICGNVRELCVDEFRGGTPMAGAALGGSMEDSVAQARMPGSGQRDFSAWRSSDFAAAVGTGFRLVIRRDP